MTERVIRRLVNASFSRASTAAETTGRATARAVASFNRSGFRSAARPVRGPDPRRAHPRRGTCGAASVPRAGTGSDEEQ